MLASHPFWCRGRASQVRNSEIPSHGSGQFPFHYGVGTASYCCSPCALLGLYTFASLRVMITLRVIYIYTRGESYWHYNTFRDLSASIRIWDSYVLVPVSCVCSLCLRARSFKALTSLFGALSLALQHGYRLGPRVWPALYTTLGVTQACTLSSRAFRSSRT